MASQAPWYADQERGETLFSRTRGFNSDSENRRSPGIEELSVPDRSMPEHRGSFRRSGERPHIWRDFGVCETCEQAVEENDTRCSGCNQRSHDECRGQVKLGEKFRTEMCYMCINYVKHELRKARAARAFQ